MKNLADEVRGLEWAAKNPPVFMLIEGPHDEASFRAGWEAACQVYAGMLDACAEACRDAVNP